MSERLVAVIDQGSTSTKGAVFTLAGERLRLESIPVERRVEGTSVRHDAEALADGVEGLLRTLLDSHPVTAFGIACQRSTCLVWERDGARALTEALSWQDRSQARRVESLAEHGELIRERTGLRLTPYYAAPKLAALVDDLPSGPERAARGELVGGTLDAFLVHRLTDRPATEPGTGGRTLLYNLAENAWDVDLCRIFGIEPGLLPDLRASAGHWGEFEGVPLLAVAGDQQASLIGHGGWRRGTAAAHFGTGAFVLASTGESAVRHAGLLTAVLASTPRARRFQIEGSVNSAGSAVDWARSLTGTEIEAWADRPIASDAPLVLPSFAGTAAPWWRSGALGVIAGLDLGTSGDDLFAGVLAGVGHRVLDCVEAVAEAGVEVDVLRVSGKLSRLRGLVRLLADAGQVPVEVSAEEETGALGLVRLIASQVDSSEEPLRRDPATSARLEPAWSPTEARRARGRWLDFVHRALEL